MEEESSFRFDTEQTLALLIKSDEESRLKGLLRRRGKSVEMINKTLNVMCIALLRKVHEQVTADCFEQTHHLRFKESDFIEAARELLKIIDE